MRLFHCEAVVYRVYQLLLTLYFQQVAEPGIARFDIQAQEHSL